MSNVAGRVEPVTAMGGTHPPRLDIRTTIAAVALSTAVGLGVIAAPQAAAVTAALLVAVGVVYRLTSVLFGVALLLLAYSPEYLEVGGLLARPELQKGAIYLALLPLMVMRGVHPKLCLPLIAYVSLATLSVLHGDLASGLSISQMISTYITLTVGWIALAVRWRGEEDLWLLKLLTFVPLMCVGLGALFQVAGIHAMFEAASAFDPVTRLRGASIASQLGLTSFIACAISMTCWRIMRWRPAAYMFFVNVAILAATASRGPIIALGIALLWPALRYGLGSLRGNARLGLLRIVVVASAIGVLAVTVAPRLESRNSGGRYYAGYGTTTDPSSGREQAWGEFYAIGKESPLYGHGLGSGPITKIEQEGFLAQHNEFLRLFLEGGYIGGGIVLASMIFAVALAISRAPPQLRLDLVGVAIGLAFLSVLDNTLSSVNVIVPFCLLLGIVASLGRAEGSSRARAGRRRSRDDDAPALIAT